MVLAESRGFLAFLRRTPGALGAQTAAALAGHALDLACAAALLLGCAAAGRDALRRWSLLGAADETESWLAGAAVGLAAAGYGVLLLGLAGLYRPAPLVLVWAAAAAYGLWRLRELPPAPRVDGLLDLACAAAVCAALLTGAAAAGAPVTDWDSLCHHLALPKLYLMHGSHLRLDWSMTTHYPQATEVLGTVLLTVRGPRAAQWLQWLCGAAALAAVARLAARLSVPAAAWPAAALLAVQPPFQRVLGTAKSDLASLLAATAALAALAALPRREDARARLGAGLAAGAQAAIKSNGLWTAAALTAVSAARGPRAAGWFAAGAALLGSGWLLRNWAAAGSPLWPFLSSDAAAAAAAARQLASITGGVERTAANFLLLPGLLAFQPERFNNGAAALALAFLALLALRLLRRLPAGPGWLLAFCALYLVPWFLSYQEGRHLLPVLAAAAALSAGWAAALWSEGGQRRFHGLALLALGLSPLAALDANNALFGFLAVRPSDGGPPAERYLERALGAPYAAQRAANAALPRDAKVALLYEVRGYYLERDFAYINPLDTGPVDWAALPDGEALRARLRELGFTHALYNPTVGSYQGDRAYYDHADRLIRELTAASQPVAAAGPIVVYGLTKVERPSRTMRRTRAAKER